MLCVLSDSNQETPLEEFWYKSQYNYEEITGDIEYSPGKSVIFNNVGFSYYKDKSVLNNINIESNYTNT